MEVWKDIPFYEGLYEASNLGEIRTKEGKTTFSVYHGERVWKQRKLKQSYKKNKYGRFDAMVTLWKDKKPCKHLVSRLIATTFHDNLINTKYTVNHKDGNTLNNNEKNLEWLTLEDNIKYGFANNQYKRMMKEITITNNNTGCMLYAESYGEMDRLLKQYRGYTSRMIKLNSDVLIDKQGQVYSINSF